ARQLHRSTEDGRAVDEAARLQEGGEAYAAGSLAGAEPRAGGAGAQAGRGDQDDAARGNRTRGLSESLCAAGPFAPPLEAATGRGSRHGKRLGVDPPALQLALLVAIQLPAVKVAASLCERWRIPPILGELLVCGARARSGRLAASPSSWERR